MALGMSKKGKENRKLKEMKGIEEEGKGEGRLEKKQGRGSNRTGNKNTKSSLQEKGKLITVETLLVSRTGGEKR